MDEARLVSSCLSCPSNASPLFSLLLAKSGVKLYTLDKVNPGPTGHPSLQTKRESMHVIIRQPLYLQFPNSLWFYLCNRAFILCSWKETNIRKLTNRYFDFLNRSVRVVGHVDIDCYRFPMIIQFLIQRSFQMEFVWWHHKLLWYFDRRLFPLFGWSIHYLPYSQSHRISITKQIQIR